MFDPLIDWLYRVWAAIARTFRTVLSAIAAPFVWLYQLYQNSGWIFRILVFALMLPFIIGYLHFIWNALWIRDFNLDYPQKFVQTTGLKPAGEQVAIEGGTDTTKSCGRSQLVDVTADLIDFNVNRNAWMSSNPLYKIGFFGVIEWDNTWFFDNKAAFQRGIHEAVSRTAIELADTLGRTRGTSQVNSRLRKAKGYIQFDQRTWYFNLGDNQPFGPTTPSQSYYRDALALLGEYNGDLEKCNATFDARADNLLQFLDRVARHIGSTSAEIKDRAEAYNSGWFDTRADDIFMRAKGELYAYYGILKGARADFADVVQTRRLDEVWNNLDEHMRKAIELDPMVISNGREDGWIMPTHLTTIGFYILRARANLVEIRSVLER